jgi:predicted  nucleic acid-binding Zn-ribbon protein
LEPKINEYNYKITLLEEKKEPIDVSLQAILPKIETINGKVASLEPEIISQQNKVNRLNDNVKENCRILGTISSPISLPTDSSECIIARKRLKEVMKPLPMMEEDYDSLLNSRKDLLDNKDALEQKIKDIEDDIAEIKQDIRDFKNENKNPIIGTFLFIFGAI